MVASGGVLQPAQYRQCGVSTLRYFAAGGEARNSPSLSTANGCRNSFQRRPRGQTSSGVRLRLAGQSSSLQMCATYRSMGQRSQGSLFVQPIMRMHGKPADREYRSGADLAEVTAGKQAACYYRKPDLAAVLSPSATIRLLAVGTGRPTHSRTLCST